MIDEVGRYDARSAADVTAQVRKEADVQRQADAYIACYREVIDEHRRIKADHRQSFEMLSEHLQAWSPRRDTAWPWMEERARLMEELRLAGISKKAFPLDQPVSFADGANPSDYLRMTGFHDPEDWGTWTQDAAPSVCLQLSAPFRRDLCVEIMVTPFVCEGHEHLQVGVSANGKEVGRRAFDRSHEGQTVTWTLPLPKLLPSSPLWLNFEIESPASPHDLGLSRDERRLGLGFMSLALRSGGTSP